MAPPLSPVNFADWRICRSFVMLNLNATRNAAGVLPAIFVSLNKRILTVEVLGSGDAPTALHLEPSSTYYGFYAKSK